MPFKLLRINIHISRRNKMKGFIEFLRSNVALIAEIILLIASITGIMVYTKDAKVITVQILELVAAAGIVYNLYKR